MATHELARSILERGISRPTLYTVRMPNFVGNRDATQGLTTGVSTKTNAHLDLFVKNITIPEGRLDVVQANGQEFMGITRETPQNFIYGKPLTMTVIENSDFDIYRSMRSWIESTALPNRINQNGVRTIRMNYYDSFTGEIEVIKLENPNTNKVRASINDDLLTQYGYKVPLKWTFINAYPIRIGSVTMGSDMNNIATEFEVAFTYESYSISDVNRRDDR